MTTDRTVIVPPELGPPAGHFERAVLVDGWLIVSGTSALSQLSGAAADRRPPAGFAAQAEITFDNLDAVLRAAGGTLADLVELRVVLRRREDWEPLNEVLRRRLPERGFACHGYQGEFLHPELELEVEGRAWLPATRSSVTA